MVVSLIHWFTDSSIKDFISRLLCYHLLPDDLNVSNLNHVLCQKKITPAGWTLFSFTTRSRWIILSEFYNNTRRCFISNILAEWDSTCNYWAFKEDSVANYNYICISRRLKFQLMRDMITATSSTLSATLYGVAVTTFKWQLLFPQ